MRILYVPWLSIIFCWIYLSVDITVVSGQIVEEQDSLLKLKNNLKFRSENSTKLVSWNQSNGWCEWSGVTCDEERHVIGLDLSGESICGGFDNSSSLFSLQNLQSLNLASNNFNSVIPSGFSKLKSLSYLNLSLAGFVGQIPLEISHLTRLVTLDLHSNQLQGQLPIFPVHLTYLDYSSNNFSSTIPSDIGTHLAFIIFLSLSENNLSGSIPQSLCNNSNLLVLDVSYNRFKGTIPECLTKSETLVVLNLQHNMLHGNIPDTFPESCGLRTLNLNGNLLGGSIPNSLANCRSLELLDLGNNQINGRFPCFLNKLSRLRVVVLRENKFHGPFGCPQTNGTWHMLQIVDLAFNYFSGSLPGKWFKTWEDSVTLTSRGLQMEMVNILTVFTSVDFSFNNFQGPIPEELMNFTGLRVLNLSYNALTGLIPSSIGNLKQLESLDLSSNHFDGEIPPQLASLHFLSYLDLSFNHLVGKIPTGGQLDTFDASSFSGNEELCGTPLIKNCSDGVHGPSVSTRGRLHLNIISVELGLISGLGLVIGPLMYWKQWRQWYWKHVDIILCCIFPKLNLEYEFHGGRWYQVLRWRH